MMVCPKPTRTSRSYTKASCRTAQPPMRGCRWPNSVRQLHDAHADAHLIWPIASTSGAICLRSKIVRLGFGTIVTIDGPKASRYAGTSDKYELAINLKTAKALGITSPTR